MKFTFWTKFPDVFFEDFTKVFAKLVELGIQRDEEGNVTNADNERGGYHAAPKKSGKPDTGKTTDDKVDADEGEPLKKENQKIRDINEKPLLRIREIAAPFGCGALPRLDATHCSLFS